MEHQERRRQLALELNEEVVEREGRSEVALGPRLQHGGQLGSVAIGEG